MGAVNATATCRCGVPAQHPPTFHKRTVHQCAHHDFDRCRVCQQARRILIAMIEAILIEEGQGNV